MIKTFAHIDNCHCITDTIYAYKRLVNAKYRLMETETSTLLHSGFKKTDISKQLNTSRLTVYRAKHR